VGVGSADGPPRPVPDRRGRRGRRAALASVALVVVALVALAALDLAGRLPGGLVADEEPTPTPTVALDPRPVDAPAVLPGEPTASGDVASTVQVPALERLLADEALGSDAGAVVLDVVSGTVLLDRDGDRPRTPASVAKLATGAAALLVLGSDRRLRTRVVAGASPGEVVLVGAGDATLRSRPGRGGAYPRRADLVALADAVAAAQGADVPAAGAGQFTVRVDDSLFAGPAVSPDWPATYVGSGVVSPVSALSVDAGRVRPGADAREPDPALAAGRDLARLLVARGLEVAGGVERAVAPPGAVELAGVESPTVAELVELMLADSDNDLAEALLRLVAVERGRPGSFSDGSAEVRDALVALGVADEGTVLLDGSGLARGSAVAPSTLTGLLARAADGSVPGLGHLVTGMPVAGFDGTLALRFDSGRPADAAGLVRAKTGTLTGVSTLAGVTSSAGRPVVFAVMADRVPGDTLAARDALDRFAAVLSGS
jgi:D-alanyl-D-alanine carboxypeptidase/D-alanyl-D-alanine-endopeptidase (penicillin-binding protein 4)